jgi:hypothetical protein
VSRSSSSELSTTGTYLSDGTGSIASSRYENLIHNAIRIYLFMTLHTSSYQYMQV